MIFSLTCNCRTATIEHAHIARQLTCARIETAPAASGRPIPAAPCSVAAAKVAGPACGAAKGLHLRRRQWQHDGLAPLQLVDVIQQHLHRNILMDSIRTCGVLSRLL